MKTAPVPGTDRDMEKFRASWLLPKYWLSWVLLGGWRLLGLLPWRLGLMTGALLGEIIRLLSARRRLITRTNIRICSAQLGEDPARLERQHFRSLGMGFTESAIAWWGTEELIQGRLSLEVKGRELIDDWQRQGHGILLLPLHYTFLELLPALPGLPWPLVMIARPHNNPLIDWHMRRGRMRWVATSAAHKDPWDMLATLRAGGICIYFADQDYGAKSHVFSPFFGVQASTTVLGRRMAQRAKAKVALLAMRRTADGYLSEFHDFSAYLQAPDDKSATALMHSRFEDFIGKAPEQWLWSHRRFKTRPPGAEHLYPGSLAKH